MPQPGYRSVSLPEGVILGIIRLLEGLKDQGIDLGYKTTAEFIKEAIRDKVTKTRTIYLLGVREE